jgi:hypothetical protein
VLIGGLLSACLAAAVIRPSVASTLRNGPATVSPNDMVAVTEDRAAHVDGCDAISVFDLETGEALYRGPTSLGDPSRIVANPDMSLLVASAGIGGGGLYVTRHDAASDDWTSIPWLPGPVSMLTGLALLGDGDTLIAGGNGTPPIVDGPPFFVSSFRLAEATADGLGSPHARFDVTDYVAEIVPSLDGQSVHVITRDALVETLSAATLQRQAAPIQLAPFGVGRDGPLEPPGPDVMRYLHRVAATLSLDGRFLYTNRWDVPEVNVADVIDRQAWTVSSGNEHNGGIAVNHGWINRGLLAIHALDSVVVYRIDSARQITELSRLPVAPPLVFGDSSGPRPSIAWSTAGDRLIAATTHRGPEFVVITVQDGGLRLDVERYLEACPDRDPNTGQWYPSDWPNDVLTLNGMVTPTLSPPSTTPPPSATPSPTLTLTPTATPTSTPTQPPRPVYLPILLHEPPCPEHFQAVDVILALDASTTMLENAGGGQSKLAAARAAARILLGELYPGQDQAAIVIFSDDASVLQPLTADITALDAALDGITVHEHTRIDRGIEEAARELAGARHRPANRPIIVLLTDGRANPVPAEVAEQRAAEAKATGITVFAVGLGADIDRDFLRRIASSPDHYYEAPDATALAEVYHRIAARLPCPAGAWWGQSP